MISAVALGAALPLHASPSGPPPDLILHGAVVLQVEPPDGRASAVALREGRIVFVGDDPGALALRGERTRVVDLRGRTIIPGLIDAHGHVASLGFALQSVDAVGTTSADEVAARVREAAASAGAGEWIRGRGWDQNDWPKQLFPDRSLLDAAAPAHPVVLERIDGHAIWVNSKALALAGITGSTPDPKGGRILRDPQGEATGIFVDNATGLVESRIPPPTRAQTRSAILRALEPCLDSGLTGVHDAGVTAEVASIYKDLADRSELPLRVYVMLGGNSNVLEDYFPQPPQARLGGGFLDIRAIKLGIDGALGSRGAALLEDYSDEPGNRGLITRSPDEIESLARQAARKGYQVCVHAIGDRGNRQALDALERALRSAPPGDHRFRIEHAQILTLADIPRFTGAGIIPSMQPTHCTSDMPWAGDRLGPRRVAGAYAWRQLLRSGARIPGGSDFPVESENPFLGLYAAITRQDPTGLPAGGWQPEERMTRMEALRAFTIDAAWAGFREDDLGSITVGKRADLVILARNPLEVDPRDLLSMRPEAVIVEGRVVRALPGLHAALLR